MERNKKLDYKLKNDNKKEVNKLLNLGIVGYRKRSKGTEMGKVIIGIEDKIKSSNARDNGFERKEKVNHNTKLIFLL